MLRPAFRGPDPRFDDAFRELSGQEWIDLQRDETLDTTFLEVDRNLHPRLLDYFRTARPGDLDDAASRLGDGLRIEIEQRPLRDISVELVDAAVRMLPPTAASRVWDELTRRLAADDGWAMATGLTSWLLGENGAVASETHPLQAAVRAVLTAVVTHTTPFERSTQHWTLIKATLANEPNPVVRAWLQERAGAFDLVGSSPEVISAAAARLPDVLGDFAAGKAGQDRAEQVAASYLAALEAIVEAFDEVPTLASVVEADSNRVDPAELALAVGACLEAIDPFLREEVRPFVRSLRARAFAAEGRYDDAVGHIEGTSISSPEPGQRTVQRWLDWVAPTRIDYRFLLEETRLVPALVDGRRPAPRSIDLPRLIANLDLIDAERYASALLEERLARGVVSAPELEPFVVRSYRPAEDFACVAHRATPQLFVTVALGWLALGQPDAALQGLKAWQDGAYRTGRDPETLRAAEVASLAIARRMRLTDSGATLVSQYANSSNPDDFSIGLPIVALTRGLSEQVRDSLASEWPSLWWRCQVTVRYERFSAVHELALPSWESLPPPPYTHLTAIEAARVLDAVEGSRVFGTPIDSIEAFPAQEWASHHPRETEAGARLGLRAAALGVLQVDGGPTPEPSSVDDLGSMVGAWATALGDRRMADLALDEGELLALRMPEDATKLLEFARGRYATSGDLVGELIASICIGIAAANAGHPASAPLVIERLQDSYERTRQSLPESRLPASTDIVEAARKENMAVLDTLGTDPWAPWIRRLYLVFARASAGGPVPNLTPGPRAETPTELLFDVYAGLGEPAPQSNRLATLIALVVPFAFLLALIAAGAGFTGWPWWAVAAIVLVGLVLVTALFLAVGRLRGTLEADLHALSLVSLDITPTDGIAGRSSATDARSVTLRLTRHVPFEEQPGDEPTSILKAFGAFLQVGLQVFGSRTEYHVAGDPIVTTATVSGQTYKDAATTLQGPVVAEVRTNLAKLNGRSLPIALRPDVSVANLAWEAIVALAVEPDTVASKRRVIPYRVAPRADSSAHTGRRRRVLLVADPALAALGNGWLATGNGRLIHESEDLANVLGVDPGNRSSGPDWPEIIHIVGRPIATATGVAIQVASVEARAASKTVESAVRSSGMVVRPGDFSLRDTALVVIQVEPSEPSFRLESDREVVARVRQLADDAIAAGAETVITVPSLPSVLAEDVVTHLARRLGPLSRLASINERVVRSMYRLSPSVLPGTYFLRQLTEAVAEARTAIESWPQHEGDSGLDPSTYTELALDVGLSIRVPDVVLADTPSDSSAAGEIPGAAS